MYVLLGSQLPPGGPNQIENKIAGGQVVLRRRSVEIKSTKILKLASWYGIKFVC